MADAELAPCPFCGCDVCQMGGDSDFAMLFVACPRCKAMGPTATDEASAVKSWNRALTKELQ